MLHQCCFFFPGLGAGFRSGASRASRICARSSSIVSAPSSRLTRTSVRWALMSSTDSMVPYTDPWIAWCFTLTRWPVNRRQSAALRSGRSAPVVVQDRTLVVEAFSPSMVAFLRYGVADLLRRLTGVLGPDVVSRIEVRPPARR